MDKFQEIKKEYDDYIDFLRQSLPDVELGDSPLLYYLSATLKIWGSNVLYSPDYRTLLSFISGTDYTIEQVVSAMGCCGDEERLLAVPDFFDKLVDKDSKNESNLASSFIEKLNEILFASATINGDFTVEEANCLSSIIDGLKRSALSCGVDLEIVQDYSMKITDKKLDTYLQNNAS